MNDRKAQPHRMKVVPGAILIFLLSVASASAAAPELKWQPCDGPPSGVRPALIFENRIYAADEIIHFVFSFGLFQYSNSCHAVAAIGHPSLVADDVSKTVELKFAPMQPPVNCLDIFDPVCGLRGSFGPLAEGTWTLRVVQPGSTLFEQQFVVLAAQQPTLSITSTPITGVPVTGTVEGATNFTVDCSPGAEVTLACPPRLSVSDVAYEFLWWSIDGTRGQFRDTSATVTVDAFHAIVSVWRLVGDVNLDCVVNVIDLIAVRNSMVNGPVIPEAPKLGDVDGNGRVNVMDLIFVRNHLGTRCR